jgi:hypothetical protein
MKKHFTLLLFMLAGITALHAQIPNASFENWTTTGSYSTPDGWDNFNSLTSTMGVYTCEKGTNAPPHGGAYLKLTTRTVGTKVVPGLALSGKYDAVNLEPESGFPFTGRPAAITGKWQYMGNGSNIARIAVYLTKWNAATKTTEVIGKVEHDLPGMVMSWTSFSIPITYTSGATPDSAIIGITSSNKNATDGSYLYVDSLNFFGTVVGVQEMKASKYDLKLSPNPATENVSIDFGTTATNGVKLWVMDVYGRVVKEETFRAGERIYNMKLGDVAKGIYFVKVGAGEELQTRQLVIQ